MENLRELCEGYNINNMSYWRNIPSSKASVIKNYLEINEDPILFYDSTLFSSGKNGLAVCESGIYWKDMMVPAKYISWKSMRSLKISQNNATIRFGEDLSVGTLRSDTDQLFTMLSTIRVGAKIDNFFQKTTGFLGFLDKAATYLSELDTSSKNTEPEKLGISSSQVAVQPTKIIEAPPIQSVSEPVLWTIACKGSTFGPYSVAEAKSWLLSNKEMKDKIFLWKKGMPSWEPIENIPEFNNYISSLSELPPLPNF